MKLYQTPGGTWAGSEKDYKAAMKAEGSDPKAQARKQVDVPTDKAGLMEFLTFHNVNVVNPRPAAPLLTVDEMFAGDGLSPAPEVTGDSAPSSPPPPPPVAPTTVSGTLDDLFEAAPLALQLHLAALACENARSKIR